MEVIDNDNHMIATDTPQYMTIEEVAEFLRVSPRTVYRFTGMKDNPLPSYKLSRRALRVDKNELINWVNAQRKESNE